MSAPPTAAALTVGVIAGGRGARLGGLDKAWLEQGGTPQVLRWQARFAPQAARFLVSANRDLERYAAHGIEIVVDRTPDAGPMSGLDALAAAVDTPWLLTLPVDLCDADARLLPMLALLAGDTGACAQDDDGVQPLVALWPTQALRRGAAEALVSGDYAVRALQRRLGMGVVRLQGVRFGNLNTPDDLIDAGIAAP